MEQLQVTARLRIHDGKVDEFKQVAARCLASVLEKDAGTLQYDWFLNAGETECVVRETYADSDAVLQHIANLGATFGDLLAVSDIELEVFGDPSPALQEATEGLKPAVYGYMQGK